MGAGSGGVRGPLRRESLCTEHSSPGLAPLEKGGGRTRGEVGLRPFSFWLCWAQSQSSEATSGPYLIPFSISNDWTALTSVSSSRTLCFPSACDKRFGPALDESRV